jgi:hypothetical protein
MEPEIRKILLAANVMMGNDENCATWLMAHRAAERGDDAAAAERAARRERRRARTDEAPAS